jgi:hypothetical protein
VHCSDEISTCFIDNFTPGNGAWGWSINLASVDLSDGKTLSCNVYAGAAQCSYATKGVLVGTFIISEISTSWSFVAGVGGSDFHLYAGKCEANDAGNHLLDPNQECDPEDIAQFARVPGQYTLIQEFSSSNLASTFSFDQSNQITNRKSNSNWGTQNYLLFPLGHMERQYLSGHATVCPLL